MFVTIKYKNEVPIESLRNEGLFIENKNISINLDNSGNATIETNNPKTMNNYLILIVFLVLLFITVLSIKKKKGTLVLVVLLLPVVALAIEKLEIKINTNIKITANPVCRMATTQHFERCEAYGTTAGYYCASYINYGSNIYFGNIENDGVLNVGDAFDCDVNNDGEYNPTTERFYYISPEDGDESSNNIVLLYYNNVIGGVPKNSQPTIFCNSYLDMAPSVAYRELPTTTQWSNKLLYSNFERQIKTTSGKTYINDEGDIYNLPVFNYTDRAARLATYKELTYNCSTNHLENNCSFLLENTNNTSKNNIRGYWTESYYNSIFNIRIIRGDLREFGYDSINYEYANGVRPVIVINRNNILY